MLVALLQHDLDIFLWFLGEKTTKNLKTSIKIVKLEKGNFFRYAVQMSIYDPWLQGIVWQMKKKNLNTPFAYTLLVMMSRSGYCILNSVPKLEPRSKDVQRLLHRSCPINK